MEAVADLVAEAVEADVFQRAAFAPGVDPESEDALVGLAELAGAGHHAAAVDPDREIEGQAVFEGESLGGELGGAVEGNWRGGGEGFGDAGRRKAEIGKAES